MKKIIYFILFLATLGMGAYTVFYALSTNKPEQPITQTPPPVVATTTSQAQTLEPGTKVLTTKTGKVITLTESNPAGESLSTILITATGLASATPITLEKNKMTDAFLADLNNDGYDELIVVTTVAGTGSYGDIVVYTTKDDKDLLPVLVPQIKEEDVAKGGLFEGYQGHDSFVANNNKLIREFPIYLKTDTNENPTGGKRKLIYNLEEKNSSYLLTITKEPAQPQTTSSTSSPQGH